MNSSARKERRLAASLLVAAAAILVIPARLHAQSTGQDWEKAAGGRQSFEVASVRENQGGARQDTNVSLDGNGNAYWVLDQRDPLVPGGGLFSATNTPLIRFIIFAYHLNGTQELALRFNPYRGLGIRVPDWVKTARYDIEARAPGHVTKDQMRLMMQSLLEDRFKLAVHWETRQAPVLAPVQEKPGRLGPHIEPHRASDDCANAGLPDQANTVASSAPVLSALPIPCGWIAHLPPGASGDRSFGGRNVTLAMLASSMPAQTGLVTVPLPVLDRTGLQGGYDLWLEWTPEDTSEVNNTESGGTFRDALKRQLGLKLVSGEGPVEVLVIDHVEEPSPN